MKVKEVRFRPLGRRPLIGEWFRHNFRGEGAIYYIARGPNVDGEAVERTEVEVEVEDAVPEWIRDFRWQCKCGTNAHAPWCDWAKAWADFHGTLAAAYRSHVESRAKAAAERIGGTEMGRYQMERAIGEEFLKP